MPQLALVRTEPKRLKFCNAYLFYGDRSITVGDSPFLERWRDPLLTEDDVRDRVSQLCRDIARLTGDTLAPAEVYRRGKFKEVSIANLPGAANLPAYLKKPKFVFHGSGFNLTWDFADA